MSTNYYLYKKPLLSRARELVGLRGRNEVIRRWLRDRGISSVHPMHGKHIGESSGGWCFRLHVSTPNTLGSESWSQDPFSYILDLWDWLPWLKDSAFYIANEYGDEISVDEMTKIIQERQFVPGPAMCEEMTREGIARFYATRGGVRGPGYLCRHKIDGHYCIGHGAGTWDLIIGEFS